MTDFYDYYQQTCAQCKWDYLDKGMEWKGYKGWWCSEECHSKYCRDNNKQKERRDNKKKRRT